jgi:hypothetical protein
MEESEDDPMLSSHVTLQKALTSYPLLRLLIMIDARALKTAKSAGDDETGEAGGHQEWEEEEEEENVEESSRLMLVTVAEKLQSGSVISSALSFFFSFSIRFLASLSLSPISFSSSPLEHCEHHCALA